MITNLNNGNKSEQLDVKYNIMLFKLNDINDILTDIKPLLPNNPLRTRINNLMKKLIK